MNKATEYNFSYNVPHENDCMGRHDLFLNVRAELIVTCLGMHPIVSVVFTENYSTYLLRIKNIQQVVSECERIGIEHFTGMYNTQFSVVKTVKYFNSQLLR